MASKRKKASLATESIRIEKHETPHYRSEGRRQGSCGVFWGLYNTICALYICVVT